MEQPKLSEDISEQCSNALVKPTNQPTHTDTFYRTALDFVWFQADIHLTVIQLN